MNVGGDLLLLLLTITCIALPKISFAFRLLSFDYYSWMIFFIDDCGAPVVLWQRWNALHAFILCEVYVISSTVLCIGNTRLSSHMEHLVVFGVEV